MCTVKIIKWMVPMKERVAVVIAVWSRKCNTMGQESSLYFEGHKYKRNKILKFCEMEEILPDIQNVVMKIETWNENFTCQFDIHWNIQNKVHTIARLVNSWTGTSRSKSYGPLCEWDALTWVAQTQNNTITLNIALTWFDSMRLLLFDGKPLC